MDHPYWHKLDSPRKMEVLLMKELDEQNKKNKKKKKVLYNMLLLRRWKNDLVVRGAVT